MDEINNVADVKTDVRTPRAAWIALALAGVLVIIGVVSYYLATSGNENNEGTPVTGYGANLTPAEQARILENLEGQSGASDELTPAEQARVLDNLESGETETKLTPAERGRVLETL